MLNYANLNDMEFEALCRDIMERILGVSLRRFGPGKDGGVDLTDDVSTKTVVVQVKHYRNSPIDQLVRSLKNELPKVKKLSHWSKDSYLMALMIMSPAIKNIITTILLLTQSLNDKYLGSRHMSAPSPYALPLKCRSQHFMLITFLPLSHSCKHRTGIPIFLAKGFLPMPKASRYARMRTACPS